MKVSDIYNQTTRDINDDYNLGDVIDWINRGLDDLTPYAKRQASITLDENFILPTDLHQLLFVSQNGQFLKSLPMSDSYSEGYKLWGDSLILQNTDDSPVSIYYYRKLNHVKTSDDVPDLEEQYHDLLILFCLGNMQFHDEDYDSRQDSLVRYESKKLDYVRFIEKRDRKARVTEKVIW
jgi:hypothetical protein